jgi:CDP-glucose 4,6-dehydratase
MENLVAANLFNSIYNNRKVFITGHTGFKGSWLSFWLTKMGAKVVGFSLPEKTTPSHFDLLACDIQTYSGDIRDAASLTDALTQTKPDIVFHLAAQSLVRESYHNPAVTYETNVIGTLNVLEAVRKTSSVKAFVNVTTDKVYENKEWLWPYRENDNLGGYDLYSSSKACSEILTASYRDSFFNVNKFGETHQVLLATARAGNVIGGGDWAEDRLIPDVVRATTNNKIVDIRNPAAIRPWEHVLEPLSGYLLLAQRLLEQKKEFAGAWNFGPEASHTVAVSEVLESFRQHWPEANWAHKKDPNAPHEARILKLDTSKANSTLMWHPVWDLEDTLFHTATWYKTYYTSKRLNTWHDLTAYVHKATQKNQSWTRS